MKKSLLQEIQRVLRDRGIPNVGIEELNFWDTTVYVHFHCIKYAMAIVGEIADIIEHERAYVIEHVLDGLGDAEEIVDKIEDQINGY